MYVKLCQIKVSQMILMTQREMAEVVLFESMYCFIPMRSVEYQRECDIDNFLVRNC